MALRLWPAEVPTAPLEGGAGGAAQRLLPCTGAEQCLCSDGERVYFPTDGCQEGPRMGQRQAVCWCQGGSLAPTVAKVESRLCGRQLTPPPSVLPPGILARATVFTLGLCPLSRALVPCHHLPRC